MLQACTSLPGTSYHSAAQNAVAASVWRMYSHRWLEKRYYQKDAVIATTDVCVGSNRPPRVVTKSCLL
eukprot:738631-Amphidinium_carterae.1